AGRVFGRELDVFTKAFRPFDRFDRLLHDLGLVHLQFELPMDRAGGEEHVNPPAGGVAEGLAGAVDVFVPAAGQAADDGAVAELAGDGLDGLEVAGRGDGEAGLDDVDAQLDQRI